MTTIRANVTRMFESNEPWDCSNSVFNLGDQAGRLTWECAIAVAKSRRTWLLSSVRDACEGMREWAISTGAWDREEIKRLSNDDLVALFVQNVASELRDLGSDDRSLEHCLAEYHRCVAVSGMGCTETVIGHYYTNDHDGAVCVDYYTGI